MASAPGRTTQPAAATADNFKNWRLAILLNGISLVLNNRLLNFKRGVF